MKKLFYLIFILVLASGLTSQAQFLKNAQKILNQKSGGFTESEGADGIKEALEKGTSEGVNLLSKTDGYLGNPEIKIPFPEDAKAMETKLRSLGFGKQVDQAITSFNRAAEDAATEAKPVFIAAIKGMTVQDAIGIVKGNNDAATQYLKKNTSAELNSKFKPSIKKSLEKVDATRYWTELVNIYNKVPMVKKMNPDLASYVTGKAIDGLFVMIAKEEKQIRENPAERTTTILKKVFGSK